MRLRNIPGAREAIEKSPCVVKDPGANRGKWQAFFGNANPVHVEIGAGKGQFLMTLAAAHPEVNYIGIEKMSSVLYRALEKREEADLPNLYFINMDAERLPEVFGPGEVGRIYLNFSDPWPKDRHHKRRLTSREFLARYRAVLSEGAVVEFKTDQVPLFEFSLEEAPAAGFEILAETRDLYKSPMLEGNVPTEYEKRFTTLGNKILKLVMRTKKEEEA